MLYAYCVQHNNLQLFQSIEDWENQITVIGIKRYLMDHVREQLVREMPVAVDAFKRISLATGVEIGFWALVRMIFAPVSYLGALYRGEDSTDNAIEFLEEYIGRRQNLQPYLDLSALIFVMFRHGLIHTSMPKVIERDDGNIIGWGVTLNTEEHLSKLINKDRINLILSPEQLYEDIVKGIDLYIDDFDDPMQVSLFDAFKKGHLSMSTINNVGDLSLSGSVKQKVTTNLNTL